MSGCKVFDIIQFELFKVAHQMHRYPVYKSHNNKQNIIACVERRISGHCKQITCKGSVVTQKALDLVIKPHLHHIKLEQKRNRLIFANKTDISLTIVKNTIIYWSQINVSIDAAWHTNHIRAKKVSRTGIEFLISKLFIDKYNILIALQLNKRF